MLLWLEVRSAQPCSSSTQAAGRKKAAATDRQKEATSVRMQARTTSTIMVKVFKFHNNGEKGVVF